VSREVQVAVFLLGVTAFSLIIHRVGIAGLLRSLHAARSAVLPAVLAWAVVYACSTLAWEQLAADERGPPIPFLRAYAISIASFALNYVTPMVALGGEPFRIAAASDWMPTPRAAASVVSFRMVHTLGELLFWLTAVPIAFVVLPHRLATTLVLAAVVVGLLSATALILAMFRHGFVERALDFAHRVPLLRALARRIEPHRAALVAVDEQMATLYHDRRGRLLAALAFEYAGRCAAMCEWFFIAHALGLHITYLTAFAIGAFQSLILILTSFVPYALGTNEGGLLLLFGLFGLPANLGIYAALIARLREMIWIAIGLTLTLVVRKANPARDTTRPSPRSP
jgi:uncharacterized protein (TIRG00374 family)